MYTPTHLIVTVHRARGLLTKGKNGSNNCFTTIGLGKEKYATSIKDSALTNVEWHEECELAIPTQGNRAELTLTCLHHNNFGIDEFLGQVSLPLNEMDQFERPRARWYKLQSKPGHDKKDKDRGELEIKISFTVKAGSLSDLSKKDKQKASLSSGVGGSLLSLGSAEKRKSLSKFAKSLGAKMHVTGKKKKDKNSDSDSFSGSFSSLGTPSMGLRNSTRSSGFGNSNADPGVISEDEDEFVFDNLSHKSSANSLSKSKSKFSNLVSTAEDNAAETASISSKKAVVTPPVTPRETPQKPQPTPRETPQKLDEWEAKLYGKTIDQPLAGTTDSLKRRSLEKTRVPLNNESGSIGSAKKEKSANPFDEASLDRISLSSDIPSNLTTPSKSSTSEHFDQDNNQLERSISEFETSENLNEKELKSSHSSPSLKERQDNIFSKKWKNFKSDFKRELAPSKPDVQLRNQYNKSQSRGVNEMIVEGRELKSDMLFKEKKREELPREITAKYEGKTKEEIMKIAHNLENDLIVQKRKNRELEEYLDGLLLRVMETHPKLLQNPYSTKNHVKQSG